MPRQTLVPPSFHSSSPSIFATEAPADEGTSCLSSVKKRLSEPPSLRQRERTDVMMAEEEGMPYFRFASTLRLVRKKRGRES